MGLSLVFRENTKLSIYSEGNKVDVVFCNFWSFFYLRNCNLHQHHHILLGSMSSLPILLMMRMFRYHPWIIIDLESLCFEISLISIFVIYTYLYNMWSNTRSFFIKHFPTYFTAESKSIVEIEVARISFT